jgi:hypothetical protein
MTHDEPLVVSPRSPAIGRALETSFAGRRFRSRLEARWAVFYTAIGVPWVYEPEGFELTDANGTVVYLPDFFLRQLDAYIEIKPDVPTAHEQRKADLLSTATQKNVYIFSGQPGYQIAGGYPSGQSCDGGAWVFSFRTLELLRHHPDLCVRAAFTPRDARFTDDHQTWCVAPCGFVGISANGIAGACGCGHDHPFAGDGGRYTYDDPRLLAAYDRANRARFEARR